jgi:hypothetical protein
MNGGKLGEVEVRRHKRRGEEREEKVFEWPRAGPLKEMWDSCIRQRSRSCGLSKG